MALTRRQKEVLDWIAGFISSNGYSPSFEEIAEGIGVENTKQVRNGGRSSAGTATKL